MYRSIDSVAIRPTTLELSWRWFHRAVAAYGMACGLYYWTRLIGINDGATWRFDLMPLHWQVASVSLAVLFPFASSGLWMISSWGAVIWFLCAVIEVTMHAGFPELYGARPVLVALHVAIAIAYCGFRLAFFLRRRRQAD
jgi:hypothetical protein